MIYRNFIFAFVVSILMSSCVTRYYLVRHAEKACEDCTSCGLLVPQGTDRAQTLADSLMNKGIDQIFASQCLRTQKTGEPLAQSQNLVVTLYHTDQLNSFIQMLKSIDERKDILIVGHSDQIPMIIESLTNEKVTIGSNDYDNLYIITKKNVRTPSYRLEEMTYGVPTP